MVGPVRPLFVLFGSSIVQISFCNGGWGAILSEIYARKADIITRGYFGWNSRRALQILDQVFPKEAEIQPSLVIVYFGGNDSTGPHSSGRGPHVPLPEYIENMKKIGTYLKSLSDKTRVIFLTCPPINEAKVRISSVYFSELVRTNELCRTYSAALMELCKELGINAIDLFTVIQKREDWQEACLIEDGIHLSAEGSKIVAEEILKVIKEAEWEPSLHWKSIATEYSEDSPYDLVAADGERTLNPSAWTYYRETQWE
ncbi:GDSL esterase/lipase CPRD49-like isoform X1 [Salvia hispanica]|uniref:GDSL esterase/lipase CPRD49-like isoform X1 n=1 Tax=Salvia hispanica TaxID=49212 RepID=UPI002009CDF0|nr:GDSL esterase/lipase CPRD49-like isoform X1 [Salvia hispanica]